MRPVLSAALGRYPATQALLDGQVAAPEFGFAFAPIKPISRAFAPMIREQRFDVSEMAIATVLQAIAAGKPVVLLPVAVAARFQEQALLCPADSPLRGPADLAGRRIGVRAYSQTTGMWLRGILADGHGIDPAAIHWTTFEDAHVPEYRDPAWVRRAPPGADLAGMLRDGALDAAIFGNEVPDDPAFRTVFPDPQAAGAAFHARYGFTPVNHLVVVRRGLLDEHPGIAAKLLALFAASRDAAGMPPSGREALRPVFDLALRFAAAQGLVPPTLRQDDLWRDSP